MMSRLPGQLMEWARTGAIIWKQWEHLRPSPCISLHLSLCFSLFPSSHPIPPSRPNRAHKDTSRGAMKTGQREWRSHINEGDSEDTGLLIEHTCRQAVDVLFHITKRWRHFQPQLYVHTVGGKAIAENKAWVLQLQLLATSWLLSKVENKACTYVCVWIYHLEMPVLVLLHLPLIEALLCCPISVVSSISDTYLFLESSSEIQISTAIKAEMKLKSQPPLGGYLCTHTPGGLWGGCVMGCVVGEAASWLPHPPTLLTCS